MVLTELKYLRDAEERPSISGDVTDVAKLVSLLAAVGSVNCALLNTLSVEEE